MDRVASATSITVEEGGSGVEPDEPEEHETASTAVAEARLHQLCCCGGRGRCEVPHNRRIVAIKKLVDNEAGSAAVQDLLLTPVHLTMSHDSQCLDRTIGQSPWCSWTCVTESMFTIGEEIGPQNGKTDEEKANVSREIRLSRLHRRQRIDRAALAYSQVNCV